MTITKLTLTKEITELINELKILSINDGKEYGFSIYYSDGLMFPGNICEGSQCGLQIDFKVPFLSSAFGSFHTHPIVKKINDCLAKKSLTQDEISMAINYNQSAASINDLLSSIEDLFLRGNLTDSAVLILSDVDKNNYVSVYLPKRFIPPEKFRDALYRIQQRPEPKYTKICDDIILDPKDEDIFSYVFDLFYNFKFQIPSDKDIIIERNNYSFEYKLIKDAFMVK